MVDFPDMDAPAPRPRLATVEDARRIAEVHVQARRAAYRDLVPAAILAAERVEDREVRWLSRLADREGRCWLLGDRAGLFGFAYTAPTMDDGLGADCAELYSIYLLGDRVGRGFGRLLTTHALDDLGARGFAEVVLWYAEKNLRAARFYAAAGFVADPRVGPTPLRNTGLLRRRLRRELRGNDVVAGAEP